MRYQELGHDKFQTVYKTKQISHLRFTVCGMLPVKIMTLIKLSLDLTIRIDAVDHWLLLVNIYVVARLPSIGKMRNEKCGMHVIG